MLRALIEAGVDVFRLNFSHGTHEDHSETPRGDPPRSPTDDAGGRSAVLQDLGGPKIRLGPIPGDAVSCPLGDEFDSSPIGPADDPRQLTCSYRELRRRSEGRRRRPLRRRRRRDARGRGRRGPGPA